MNSDVFEIRKHLSMHDLEFISQTLGGNSHSEQTAILKLLTDPKTVDDILDQRTLLDIVLNEVDSIHISSRLYFYLITRHALKGSGLDSPELADYISGVLNAHLRAGFHPHSIGNVFYVVDWLKQLENSPEGKRFELYVMAGNRLLFLTGIFPQLIERRKHRRGAPTIEFYESIAQRSFRAAAEHPFSTKKETKLLYHELANTFSGLRYALNDMSERLIMID